MRKTFQEYFEKFNLKHYDYDFDEFTKYCEGIHPRLPELIAKYGNPYEVSEENVQMIKMNKMAKNVVKIKLAAMAGPFMG